MHVIRNHADNFSNRTAYFRKIGCIHATLPLANMCRRAYKHMHIRPDGEYVLFKSERRKAQFLPRINSRVSLRHISMNLKNISNALKRRLTELNADQISVTGPNEKGRCEVKAVLFGRVKYKCTMNSKTNFFSGRADAEISEMTENEVSALADEMAGESELTPNAFDKSITLLDSFKAENMSDEEAYQKANILLNTLENHQDMLASPEFAQKMASQESQNNQSDSSEEYDEYAEDDSEDDDVEPGMDDGDLMADFESALADMDESDDQTSTQEEPKPVPAKARARKKAAKKNSVPEKPKPSRPSAPSYSSSDIRKDVDSIDAELDAIMNDLESNAQSRKPQSQVQENAYNTYDSYADYKMPGENNQPSRASMQMNSDQPSVYSAGTASMPPDIAAYYRQIDKVFEERKAQADERERRLDEFYNRVAERSEAVEKQAAEQQKEYDSIVGRAQADAYKIRQSADEYAARKKAETEDECAKQLLELSKDRAKIDDEKHQLGFQKMKLKEREDNLERGRKNLEEEKKILETDKRYSIITDDDAMAMQKKIDDLTFQMGLKEKEIASLNDNLRKSKSSSDNSSASVFDSLKKENDALRKENSRLEDENARLKDANEVLKQKSSEKAAASDEVMDENRRLRNSVESLNETVSKQERAIDLLRQKKASLDKELDRRRDTIDSLRNGSGMAEENNQLAEALKSARMENDNLSLEIESLNAQIETLEEKAKLQPVAVPEKEKTAEEVSAELNEAGYKTSVKTLAGRQVAYQKEGNTAIVVDPGKRCFLISKKLGRGASAKLKKVVSSLNDQDISSSYDINTKNVLTCKHAYTGNAAEELKKFANEISKTVKSYVGENSRIQVDQDDAI